MSVTALPVPSQKKASARAGSFGDISRQRDALVLDAGTRQALTTLRSLGRTGLSTTLVECRTCGVYGRWSPPAFWSRWAEAGVVVPDFSEDSDEFAAKVVDLVANSPTTVVIPGTDESIASLRPWRGRIEKHAKLALASEEALDLATNKATTLALARQLGIPVPRGAVVGPFEDVCSAALEIGFPAVVKPVMSWLREHGGQRLLARDVMDETEAIAAGKELAQVGVGCLVQEWVPGRREAVGLFRAGGKILAEFAQAAMRTTPVLGGAFVLRESIPMPEDIRAAAVALVNAMELDGYSEVEFRRDRRGRALLMEINPRLSGSIELAARCGIDFPLLLWRWAAGGPLEKVNGYRVGARLRWLSGDVRWLLETLSCPGRPDALGRAKALAIFSRDFTRRAAYDCFDRHDPGPGVSELSHSVLKVGRLVSGRGVWSHLERGRARAGGS